MYGNIFHTVKNKIFSRTLPSPRYSAPIGQRAYIIGDVHGCYDPLIKLLGVIERDNASKKHVKTHIIFLGDLVDRGPKVAEVIEFLRHYNPGFANMVYLMGNHEDVLLRLLAGDKDLLFSWLAMGGQETARSYQLDQLGNAHLDPDIFINRLKRAIPQTHIAFLKTFSDYYLFGDFLCVHAGIRRGLPIERQDTTDLKWIRDDFLKDLRLDAYKVVHGHSIVAQTTEYTNRIAVDIGAYASGVLGAVCVENTEVEFLDSTL